MSKIVTKWKDTVDLEIEQLDQGIPSVQGPWKSGIWKRKGHKCTQETPED